jgi:hypothetical protein
MEYETLDWWDWLTFFFIGILFGYWTGLFFWSWYVTDQSQHGPNSRDWRNKITEEQEGCFLWDIEICACPCL